MAKYILRLKIMKSAGNYLLDLNKIDAGISHFLFIFKSWRQLSVAN